MYEPAPGVSIAPFTLSVVAIAAVAVPAGAAFASARITARSSGGSMQRSSTTTAAMLRAGAPVPVVTGTRYALERGVASQALPARPTLVAVVAGVTGMVATLTFAASLEDASSTPQRWGETWQLVTPVGGGGQWFTDPDALRAAYVDVDGVADAAVVRNAVAEIGDDKVALWSYPADMAQRIVIVEGRLPRSSTEVLLGPTKARDLGVGVGDAVTLGGPDGQMRARVAGLGLTPAASHSNYDDSGWIGEEGFDILFGAPDSVGPTAMKEAGVLTWVDDGVDPADLASQLAAATDPAGAGIAPFPPEVPSKINALDRVGALPQALGLFLAVLGVGAVGHALSSAIARRRTELAVLRAIGQTPGQTRLVAFTQAVVLALVGLLAGVPLGVALGRALWRTVAAATPVAFAEPSWRGPVLLAAPLTLVVFLVLAVPPARASPRASTSPRRCARSSPANGDDLVAARLLISSDAREPCRSEVTAPAGGPIRLGLRENLPQFLLLVAVNALVGGMIGQERTVLAAVGERRVRADRLLGDAHLHRSVRRREGRDQLLRRHAVGPVRAQAGAGSGLAHRTTGPPALDLGAYVGLGDRGERVVGREPGAHLVHHRHHEDRPGRPDEARPGHGLQRGGRLRRGRGDRVGHRVHRVRVRPSPRALLPGGRLRRAGSRIVHGLRARDPRARPARSGEPRGTSRAVYAAEASTGEVFVLTSFKEKALSSCSQAGLVNNLNDGLAWGLLPLYFAAAGLSVGRIGVLAALYPAVWGLGQIVTGGLSDRIGRKPLIAGGMLIQAAAIALDRRDRGVRRLGDRRDAARRRDCHGLPDSAGGDRRRRPPEVASSLGRHLSPLARRRLCGRGSARRRARRRVRHRGGHLGRRWAHCAVGHRGGGAHVRDPPPSRSHHVARGRRPRELSPGWARIRAG
ncbi:MAG: FtsX-like permease family protein [Microthrixaceae bacterium]